MAQADRKNLPIPAPTSQEIAEAVADIIRAVKHDRRLTNLELAAALKVESGNTIANLEEQRTAKVPASVISGIGALYGEEYIQPYMALFGCKAVPRHCEEAINALPALTALSAKLASALQDGRAEIPHDALAGMLAELREVDGVVTRLRSRASALGMVA